MISNLKNLKGLKQLSKTEQKDVKGGLQTCKIKYTSPTGVNIETRDFFADDEAGSNQANQICLSYLAQFPNDSCGYDCEYDGFSEGFEPSLL